MKAHATEEKMKRLHELDVVDIREILKESGYMTEADDFRRIKFLQYNERGSAVYTFLFKGDNGEPDLGYVYVWAEWDEEDRGVIKADF